MKTLKHENIKTSSILHSKFLILNSAAGFTLLELVVGMGIFILIMTASTAIFQQVMSGQLQALSAQNTQEAMRYALEVSAKEMRMAQKDFDGICTNGQAGKIFVASADNKTLYFKNEYDQCVVYTSDSGVFKIARGGSGYENLTPDEISVTNLKFYPKSDNQEAVTVTMTINSLGQYFYQSQMDTQTTISSRYYLESKLIKPMISD